MADLVAYLSDDSDALVQEIEAEISRRQADVPVERRQQLARRLVFNTVGVLTCVFISKAADAVNARPLRDITRRVAKEEDSVAAKIIELAARLDSPEEIPFGDLESLVKRVGGNIFARKVIDSFVYHHAYMFPTTIAEKQRLEDLLDFEVKQQRAIDLKTKPAKMTPGRRKK